MPEQGERRRYFHLEQIKSPKDLKALSEKELTALSREIRECLVERVTENGGHLASNLGVVELTMAIHRVFDAPKDHILFDVGHQSYVHKLLTGRYGQFESLRRGGGISGFPKRSESEYDAFGTGHSSTSLSAALGFAEADRLNGSDAYTVCVFGDGAYTGGMIHEALNNSRRRLRLIAILNENEMSISKNIGRFARGLSRLRSQKSYFRAKDATTSVLKHLPLIGKPVYRLLHGAKSLMKSVLYGSNYFERIGYTYFGPIDGNDEAAVERVLLEAKQTGYSCIIHVKTKKGKGYAPAEAEPWKYHGLAPADQKPSQKPNFSSVMGEELCALAQKDEKICAITAAMTGGTGLSEFANRFPQRFFDVGIAEEHAVTFAAGLAANGMRPVVAIYSTFLQRAYDNIIHDVALQNLPVVFCVDRAGLNASDGATHHGIFDVAFLSGIPNLKIYTPITNKTLCLALSRALSDSCPSVIRYPNGVEDKEITEAFYHGCDPEEIGVRADFDDPSAPDAVIVTHGRMVIEARKAAKQAKEKGISVGILLLEQLKPYEETADRVAGLLPSKACKLLFLEEEVDAGGMGMMLCDALKEYPVMQNKTVVRMALKDSFGVQSEDQPILTSLSLDAEQIVGNLI